MWSPLCVGRCLPLRAAHSSPDIYRRSHQACASTNTRCAVFAAFVVRGINDVLEGVTLVVADGDDDDMFLKQSYTHCFCRGKMPNP